MDIYYEGKVTQNDLYNILRFGAKPQPIASAIIYGGTVVFAALIGVGLWINFFNPAMLIPFVLFLLFATYFYWGPYLGSRRVFRGLEYIHHPISGWIKDEDISVCNIKQEVSFPWSAYRQVKRAGDLILLYQSANAFHFFPRKWFENENDWREFSSEIDQRLREQSLNNAGTRDGMVLGSQKVDQSAILVGCVLPAALLIAALILAIWKGIGQ